MPEQFEKKRMSLNQLLEDQAQQIFSGTIEAVEGKDHAIKLTPWLSGTGCLCHLAIVVPKESVTSVTTTEHVHLCCGKSLRVVEVEFAENATIPLKELVSQIMASAALAAERMQHIRDFAERAARRQIMPSYDFRGEPAIPFQV
jgi:hypothetical protein